MTHDMETQPPEPERTPAAHRRDLLLARQVIAQLRDQAREADEPFHVGDLALDAAALDALWNGLLREPSTIRPAGLPTRTPRRLRPRRACTDKPGVHAGPARCRGHGPQRT